MNDQSYDDLIGTALDAVQELQRKTREELRQWAQQYRPFPPTIPNSGDRLIFVTPEGYSALRKFGRTWHASDLQRSKLLSRTAAEQLALQAFGELLRNSTNTPNIAEGKSILLRIMGQELEGRIRPEHFYFPARVFDEPGVQTFSVGPVSFCRRADWLDVVEATTGGPVSWKKGAIDRWTPRTTRLKRILWSMAEWLTSVADWLTYGVIRRCPQSSLAYKLYALGATRRYIESVVKAVGDCDWVIDVKVEGRDRSRSSECASVAALVALDSLGLPMPAEAARNLRGPGHDLTPQFTYELHQIEGQPLSMATSVDWPRIGGPPGAQANFLSKNTHLLIAVGQAITAFVSVTGVGNAPNLLQRWVEAMYWFGQARREQNDFIALVKFGIALDVLAKGGYARGILELCRALFAKQDTDVIAPEKRTLKQVVEKIYNEGRSRIAHGGSLALLRELPVELGLADSLTAETLASYVVYASQYSGPDTYEDFLAAIPALRAAHAAAHKP